MLKWSVVFCALMISSTFVPVEARASNFLEASDYGESDPPDPIHSGPRFDYDDDYNNRPFYDDGYRPPVKRKVKKKPKYYPKKKTVKPKKKSPIKVAPKKTVKKPSAPTVKKPSAPKKKSQSNDPMVSVAPNSQPVVSPVTNTPSNQDKANCSSERIRNTAYEAVNVYDPKTHRLYGINTHVGTDKGYNACAIVVAAILKEAGCSSAADARTYVGIKGTASDRFVSVDWVLNECKKVPKGQEQFGDVAYWEANGLADMFFSESNEMFASKITPGKKIPFRHVGIYVGGVARYVDNRSWGGTPKGGMISTILKSLRYQAPVFYRCK